MSVTAKAPNSEKGKRYFAQLDQALCNGSWAEIPELVRKTNKHVPERGCFTLMARTEAQIASASHGPTSASSTGASSIHSLGETIPKLQEAITAAEDTLDDAYCAKACLAEIHWLQEDIGAALKALPQESVPTAATGGQTAALGWLEVCAAKVEFIRAVALEANGSGYEVRELYHVMATQTPGSRTPELRRWTERLLARACMYTYTRTSQPSLATLNEALMSFRAWTNFWQRAPPPASGSGTSATRIDIPRRQVWKAYYDLLSVILGHDLLYNNSTTPKLEALIVPRREVSNDRYLDAKSRQRAELKRVESTYESLLLSETQFPKASQSKAEVEDWVEQAIVNWRILSGAEWSDQELGEGGKAAIGRGMLDILYRAATKTFHSTAILRQLFTVHAALSEFDLAMHAFSSYVEIISKGKARAEKTGKHELGSDDDDTAILTAAEAVRVLCKYGDRKQAEQAVEVEKTIQKWLRQQRPTSHEELKTSEDYKVEEAHPPVRATTSELQRETMCAAYRAIGVSQAHWARTTYDTDARSGLQKDAVASLQKARSYDETDVETAYALARVLAETQNVPAAIDVVKRTLAESNASQAGNGEQDDDHSRPRQLVPMWHLLALCLTARDEHEAAVRTCDAAFDQFCDSSMLFGRQGIQTTHDPATRNWVHRGVVDLMDDFEKEALLQVKLSQTTLIELMEGAERAVDFSDEILRLYARLFGSPERLREPAKPPPTAASMAPPSRAGGGTLRSIAGSIRPKSARNSAERDTPGQVSDSLAVPPGSNAGGQTTSNGQAMGAPISITITNEDGVSAEKGHHDRHHLHLPFKMRGHHGAFRDVGSLRSKKSTEDLNEKSGAGLGTGERPPLVLPKDMDAMDHAQGATNPLAITSAVNHSISPEAPTSPQQPLKEIEHNRPPGDWPPPPGHEDNPLEQDVRLPALHPASSYGMAMSHGSSLHERQHKISILVKVWLFVAGLYVRAGFYDDARGAIEEALGLVEAFEADKAAQHANALALFRKGWGGGKSVDELWADVWSAKGDLAIARELPFEAMESYEQALTYFPDHPDGIIGLSDLIMDIYEEKMPAEESEPPLVSLPTRSRSSVNSPTNSSGPTTRLTTAKSSLASAGRERPPNARSKDPTPAQLNRLAGRDRAYMLLSTLTKLGTGWDNSEAWYTLARAYELSQQIEKAKQALWWVVELEDSKPMRHWSEVSPGRYAL